MVSRKVTIKGFIQFQKYLKQVCRSTHSVLLVLGALCETTEVGTPPGSAQTASVFSGCQLTVPKF